jgi:hypothetical protein
MGADNTLSADDNAGPAAAATGAPETEARRLPDVGILDALPAPTWARKPCGGVANVCGAIEGSRIGDCDGEECGEARLPTTDSEFVPAAMDMRV